MRPHMLNTVSARSRLRASVVGSGAALLVAASANTAKAQDTRRAEELMARVHPRIEAPGMPELLSFMRAADPKRAALGVTTTSGNSDTLGVLITDVTVGSPADKAGIKANSHITAINGVSLKLNGADANDPEMSGVVQRRLIRELTKVAPGDVVELRLATGTGPQVAKVKTVSVAELERLGVAERSASAGPMITRRGDLEKRASLGVSIGSTGSARDTLGLFISSVTTGGPAEKAGVFEGDRIAAINGVDVRVLREDAEDAQSSMARVSRFTRELGKLTPGDKATLRVYSGGRYREVEITTGNSADLRSNGFILNFGDEKGVMSLPRIQTVRPPAGAVQRVYPATVRRGSVRYP